MKTSVLDCNLRHEKHKQTMKLMLLMAAHIVPPSCGMYPLRPGCRAPHASGPRTGCSSRPGGMPLDAVGGLGACHWMLWEAWGLFIWVSRYVWGHMTGFPVRAEDSTISYHWCGSILLGMLCVGTYLVLVVGAYH